MYDVSSMPASINNNLNGILTLFGKFEQGINLSPVPQTILIVVCV